MFAASAVKSSTSGIPGPVPGTRLTLEYVREIGRLAYFWGWPMMNIHNRYLMFAKVTEPGLIGGIVPVAPVNQLGMLHDYVDPGERVVACPNQDVVYGFMYLSLNTEPVIVQVPDFGSRFWVYQVCDQRTDAFAHVGKMYGTKPGFVLLAGPNWKGKTPDGVQQTFFSTTNCGCVLPRAFMDNTPQDREAIQPVIDQILAYPLSQFTGHMKTTAWRKVPSFPSSAQGQEETKWVTPETFFDSLDAVLNEVPPLAGEESVYQTLRSVWDAASKDPALKQVLEAAGAEADKELITPLFQFHNYGIPLPHNWTTITNGASFGTDYFTRTAVAKSNILVNAPQETRYFYQDLDASGARLNGSKTYAVKFAKGELPPVRGFWSLTLYNEHHFFHPNPLKRYSLGTKNKTLHFDSDGSLTLYAGSKTPAGAPESNWLPAPEGEFSLYVRAYWPDAAIANGEWLPPAVEVA